MSSGTTREMSNDSSAKGHCKADEQGLEGGEDRAQPAGHRIDLDDEHHQRHRVGDEKDEMLEQLFIHGPHSPVMSCLQSITPQRIGQIKDPLKFRQMAA